MDSNIPKKIDPFIAGDISAEKRFERDTWQVMIQNFYTDVSNLFRKEGQLIRTELSEKTTEIKTAAVSLIGGGVVLFVGLFCIAATAIIMLNLVTQLWVASLIVTIVFLLVGGVMLASAKKKLEADSLKPNKSIDALGEIGHTLKEKVHEITRH